MNFKLPALIPALFLCLLAYAFPQAAAYASPSLLFDPANTAAVQNNTFQEKITINVDTHQVQSSDAVVTYAGADLEVVSVTNGGFFPEFSFANDPAGTLEIHGYSTTGSAITGTGTLATIVFKAKKGSGSSSISYTCSGGTDNTNILSTAGQNILNCTQLNQVGVSYSGDITATSTPTPTTTSGTTVTPTPTQVPGNNTSPSCTHLTTDVVSAVGTPLAVTFTCSGSDPDGTITASEFIFGDGTSQVVEKSAGSSGSIATTHTYTTIGTLGASCRMRDNNQAYSSIPDSCKKIIKIKQAPKTITASAQTGSSTTVRTPALVSIISETPTPEPEAVLPSPETTPEPYQAPQPQAWPPKPVWILGGVVALSIAFFLLRRRRPPRSNPPPVPPMNPPTPTNSHYS